MPNWKWQKARIIKSDYCPEAVGLILWALAPSIHASHDYLTKQILAPEEICITNVADNGSIDSWAPECLEFLPEGREDDPPFVEWSEFIKEEKQDEASQRRES